MKNLIIFSSGTSEGGGSGFENLVIKAREGVLSANIVGVVSNHENGGVRERADRLGVHFIHFPKPWDAEKYKQIVEENKADFVALSGWLKLARGLDPRTTFNIHPGPLPSFGGAGMYGHYVHEAVMEAFREGKVTHSAVTMHFVTDQYDRGPIFFQRFVKIEEDDTAETLAKRVNETEHKYQPIITNMVVNGEISWDGKNAESLVCPLDYKIEQY
jgi:phosphoribosylglycinamide formyltransferase-1